MRNTMSKARLTASILLLLALNACEEATAPQTPEVTSPSAVVGAVPSDAVAPDYASMDPEEAAALADAAIAAHQAIQAAVVEATTWQEADIAVRKELTSHPRVPEYQLQQLASSYMLRQHLAPTWTAPDDEALEATGFYTNLLVENESPDAPLLERSLSALEGYWSEGRLKNAAGASAKAASRWAASRADCDGCSLDEALASMPDSPGLALPEQTVSAIRALDRMAQ